MTLLGSQPNIQKFFIFTHLFLLKGLFDWLFLEKTAREKQPWHAKIEPLNGTWDQQLDIVLSVSTRSTSSNYAVLTMEQQRSSFLFLDVYCDAFSVSGDPRNRFANWPMIRFEIFLFLALNSWDTVHNATSDEQNSWCYTSVASSCVIAFIIFTRIKRNKISYNLTTWKRCRRGKKQS